MSLGRSGGSYMSAVGAATPPPQQQPSSYIAATRASPAASHATGVHNFNASPTTATSSATPASSTASHDHVHVRFKLPEISPTASPQERQTRISELSKLLHTLRDVANGRPLVDWESLIVTALADPVEGAKAITQALLRFPTQLQANLSAIAQRINGPERLAVVAELDEPYRSKVRDEVLQGVLKALTSTPTTPPTTATAPAKTAGTAAPLPPAALSASDGDSGTDGSDAYGDDAFADYFRGSDDEGGCAASSSVHGDAPSHIPLASRMMVEMIRLDLVLIRGVATTLDTLLRDKKARASASAVIGLLAERYARQQQLQQQGASAGVVKGRNNGGNPTTLGAKKKNANDEGILPTLNHVRPALQAAAADAAANSCGELDYDWNSIQRYMHWKPTAAGSGGGPHSHNNHSGGGDPRSNPLSSSASSAVASLLRAPRVLTTPHGAITSTAYFATRDELVTGGAERTVCVWGSQAITTGAPSASFLLPPATTPVAMDASVRGSLLAVACVSSTRNSPPSSSVQAYLCSESGAWTVGDVIKRPEGTVLTGVKCLALKGSVVCTVETLLHTTSGSPNEHQVALFNAAGHETRVFPRAHDDCITALGVSADSDNIIITGSRDTTIRLWDVRSPTTSTGSGGDVISLLGHKDTITSISPVRDVVVTTSLDGTLRVWDVRRTRTELACKTFANPVIKAACTANLSAVVSTTGGLFLVSIMPSIEVQDVLPNRTSLITTDLRSNGDGTVVFGVAKNTITSLAIHNHHGGPSK